MKISYNWLKQFIHTDKSAQDISGILTSIGLEVESLENVQAIPGGLDGLVVGYVAECWQHPNADRLRVTKVDIGNEVLQVVCGAPNVAIGQKVVVAPVGTKVYPVSGEPFKINSSKIRGEVSEGMICAEDEIGLGASHEGIMVLPESAIAGTKVKEYLNVNDDYLFEIGLTPNRADAASHFGVARDLAAYLKTEVIVPEAHGFITENHTLTIPVVVENEQDCPRYSSVTIQNVTVKESPAWLKDRLSVIGIKSINNIVDVTNYILHGLGQPMHAFDADTITGNKVVVKNMPDGSKFTTLDNTERTLSSGDLMICNAEEAMCIAGVFGGVKSGITSNTKNVFLESAYFNPVSIRKTSKRHGLKTDASFRYERGTDPEMTVLALKQAALLIKEIAGGQISSEISDFYPVPVNPLMISVVYSNINRLIGASIAPEEIKAILVALNITIVNETEQGLQLSVPPYKVDVTREVDVIEEILRIYGYNNIDIPTNIKASLNFSEKPDKELLQNQLADMLTANGFYEMVTNSLTKSIYSDDPEKAVQILNPLSADLDVMRQSLLYTGLEAVAYNQNRRNGDLKFYEFGKTYSIHESRFRENKRLSVFITGAKQQEQWNQSSQTVNFFSIKGIVDAIIGRFNIKDLRTDDKTDINFEYGLSYTKGEKVLVQFGAVSKHVLKKADLTKEVFFADFDWDIVLKSAAKNTITYQEVSKFPSVRRDLSMLVDTSVNFGQLKQIALKTERYLLKEINVFDVYQGEKLVAGKKSYALSFILQDAGKTLEDKQIEAIMQKLILNFEKEAGAEIRK